MTRNAWLFTTVVVILALAPAKDARAQDAHYWNLQYGTRGELLGGTVVGSAVDLSATFYNPGSLALVLNPSVILSASVFEIRTIKIADERPDQQSLSTTHIGPSPSLIAGVVPWKPFGGVVGYSFLTRQDLDARLVAREGVIVGADVPGDTLSIGGEVIFDQSLSEQWGGISWAKKSGRIGYGATLYGSYRGQQTRYQQLVSAIGDDGVGGSISKVEEIHLSAARALMKFGVSAQFEKTTLGLSVTTPGLDVWGSGSIEDYLTIVGDIDLDGINDGSGEVAYGKDLDAEFNSPTSVALGGSYSWGEFTIHGTVEWFSRVDEYTAVEAPAPLTGPGVTGFASTYVGGFDSVVNFGFGLEKRFSDRGTAYASFITDNCARSRLSGQQIVFSTWDIMHINGGVALKVAGTEVTLGGGYAWGSEPLGVTRQGEGVLDPTVEPADVDYSRIKMLLGFAL